MSANVIEVGELLTTFATLIIDSLETSVKTNVLLVELTSFIEKGNILGYDTKVALEKGNESNVWYIPQGVSLEIVRSILAHCYNSQKRNQIINKDAITKTILKTEKTVGYAVKMLENIGILTINEENDTYSLDEVSMSFAEKLATKEDVTKEVNQIIEKSFLNDILQIILTNTTISKPQFIEKILINSAAGNVKDNAPYITTIHCILDILNLSGKIPQEKYQELRGSPEQTSKKPSQSVGSTLRKKKEKTITEEKTIGAFNTSLEKEVLGIIKTASIEVKIKSIEDLEFARLALNNIEKELKSKTANNITPQIAP